MSGFCSVGWCVFVYTQTYRGEESALNVFLCCFPHLEHNTRVAGQLEWTYLHLPSSETRDSHAGGQA